MNRITSSAGCLVKCTAFLLIISGVQAQDNPYDEVSISSPTAAALAKYADIPVNYHTGIPAVSIPIHTIEEGSLTLPISLSYHASGLKVMELASWVGAGWSLNAGGVITRSVRGAPDERQTSSVYNQTHGYFSDNGYPSYYYDSSDKQDWDKFADGRKDGEPDLYFYNFNGISGKFYFREDQTPVLLPEQDIQIEPVYCSSCNESISRWIVTTPDGTQYHFGKTPGSGDIDPVDITRPFTQDNGLGYSKVVSSWYLNKIVSAGGQSEIILTYEPENYGYYTLSTFPVTPGSNDDAYKLVKNLVEGVRLSAIRFSSGQVEFIEGALRQDVAGKEQMMTEHANDEAKVLETIRISNNGALCREFAFTYDYFTDNTNSLPGRLDNFTLNTDRKRLKLESVREQTCDGSIIVPPYSFTYYNESEVPRRLTFAQDHWGFYNGVVDNYQLIPTYYVNDYNEISGADREPKWPEMNAGTLRRIDRPTGGYTEFEYEPHDTHINYTAMEVGGFIPGISAGYGGGTNSAEKYVTANGNDPYKISLRNTECGGYYTNCAANLYIYDENGDPYHSMYAGAGETTEDIVVLRSGRNRFYLLKDNPSSGRGASASITHYINQTYNEDRIVGGLRIKKITHHNGMAANPDVVKNFEYEFKGRSTGILYSRPVYAAVIRNDLFKDYGFGGGSSPEGCLSLNDNYPYYISPSSLRPMKSTQGNHIGYNEVKVTLSDGGYTIYRYYGTPFRDSVKDDLSYRRVYPNECSVNIPNFPAAPSQSDFYRGQMKYKGLFDASGKVQTFWEYFLTYEEEKVGTPAFIAQRYVRSSGIATLLGTKYALKTSKLTEKRVVKSQVGEGGDPVLKTTTLTLYGNEHAASADCKSIHTSCNTNFDNDLASCRSSYYAALYDCGSDNSCKQQAWLGYERCQYQARADYLSCWASYPCNHHLLPTQIQATNSNGTQRTTEYKYAHEYYDGMESNHMLSQPYKVTTRDGAGEVQRIDWTLWDQFNGFWHPCEQWVGGQGLGTAAPPECSN